MIERFLSVKSVGRIKNLMCSGDVQFHKVNLIYGENGSGKSTLTGILRCLGNGCVLRHGPTLGTSEPQKITVRYNGNSIKYDNGKWSHVPSDLEIFDSVFVSENVYAGDVIDHKHKKNLCNFVFGSSDVKLAAEIDKLDDEIRKLNVDIKANTALIQAYCGSLQVGDFMKLKPISSVDDLITSKKREITELKSSLELSKKSAFRSLQLPAMSKGDLNELLGKTLEDVSAEAEELTSKQVQDILDQHGEKWLEQGVGYSVETCPFCGSNITDNKLVKAYQSFFNQKYKDLKTRIMNGLSDVESVLSEQALLMTQKVFLENTALEDYWRNYISVGHQGLSFEDVKASWSMLRAEMKAALEKKKSAPLEKIAFSDYLEQAFTDYVAISSKVASYNYTLMENNKQIVAKKELVSKGSLPAVESELARLEAV